MAQDRLREVQDGRSLQAARWADAANAIERLAQARSIDDVVELLRASARRVVGADGIAVVLREGDQCHYVAEDAREPLWAGQRFAAEFCVSGWAMAHRQTVAIRNVLLDPRVPQDAYRATFVRSMLMVPIGAGDPVAAVGAYWSDTGQPSGTEIALLESLARAASTALENGRLLSSLERLNGELEQRVVDRTAELERTQEKLRQTQKMEVIGQLTGNVAHDFNNLLAPIMAALDRVLAADALSPSIVRSAALGMQAAENAKTLVQRLLAFARRQPLISTAVDLGALVENMRSLLASTIGPCVTLDLSVAPDLSAVRADRHQLEMAILNLAVNARDAMTGSGDFAIAAEAARGPLPDGLAPGHYVLLTVRDSGCGMDAATLRLATEPFFTTKDAGSGTGLGLSMVDGLISQLGGAIRIDSAPGQGTSVRLWLPVVKAAAAPATLASPDSDAETAQGTLLLVDDDALVRMGTNDILTDIGYRVTEAEDAQQALALIEDGFHPDVVVTDHVMPGMTGAEFALRLRSDHPDMAVMIISGYQGIDLIAPDIVRLSKPFRQVHLKTSLAAARAQVESARL
ncbi:ATP-binding protein [Sphingobium sufflavum]|uniref:ATP-binding protein n=1 Tax=Sphingobium sufflavum TaxID=1129547 RepID=UPI001F483DD0|nr:ATP-binding protein [Sphingobium sufflavum]MCE7796076.1 ATP-binding protein [Sphingobium sufflavum]